MPIPLIVLGVFDGFGYSPQKEGNAILEAKTPNLDYLWSHFPHFLLRAAEEEVGLSFGEMGNSEVGHIAIGTGRVIPQSLSLINKSIDDGTFFSNPAFLKAIQHTKSHNSALHLTGIISSSGVHGHLNRLINLIKLASNEGITQLYLHLILDGRDSGPRDTPLFLREINKAISGYKCGTIASMQGRAFAMDRNNNWERTQKAYECYLGKAQNIFPSAEDALKKYYDEGLDDENIPPTLITQGKLPPNTIKDNDALIISNFREDRARQITKVFSLPVFDHFQRLNHPKNLIVTTMTSYEKALPVEVAYPPPEINNTLSDVISRYQIPQIHIAESEKYAHVTYFFNGGREIKAPFEELFMIPSCKPEEFETHPEMSAAGVAKAVIDSINLGYQLIVFNFANCDMIGHTGNYTATVKAVETVDSCIAGIWQAVKDHSGYLLITADHGNAEQKIDPITKAISKEHTISPVPFILASIDLDTKPQQITKIMTDVIPVSGLLSDIAPTILTLASLPIPNEMSGTSLV